ncbi:MAG: type-F conjugative transfer system protein TraW [Legionellales bacterium RIFCSPHIGHO2_12_FULL_42_9]|nr:MAG: type-F conjugative transfer system protein TraW [Legionellales bacterium RIFCSPHIGHO2_12_FULL_42_9]
MKIALIIFICMMNTHSMAQSLVVGETFPVAEMSLLQLIQTRLQSLEQTGELNTFNQHWLHEVSLHANRPTPLNLRRATIKRITTFHPETVLEFDIKDAEGRMIYSKGTRVNALEQLPQYSPCWLFLNADDNAQINWVKRAITHCQNSKIILTGGAIKLAEDQLQTAIYFDQGGALTYRLGVHAVPAYVTRKNNTLQIEELVIKENGDVV